MPATPGKKNELENDLRARSKRRGQLDTSVLFDQLRLSFRNSQKPVEVDFRQLVDWIRLGDQETHLLHPYPAKLLPHIAHFFVHASTLAGKKSVVLDPFCGSGTVALEASLAGCSPFVADANPMALLITQVKTTPYDPEQLREVARDICGRVKRLRIAPVIAIVNDHMWYSAERKRRLEIILRAVREVATGSVEQFFLVCFSVLARRLSNADPNVSVPVRLNDKEALPDAVRARIKDRLAWLEKVDPVEEFARICAWNVQRVEEANLTNPRRKQAQIAGHDARKLIDPFARANAPLSSGTIPLIVTSPPYGSAQKYIRATSLSLNWLGMAEPRELKHLEAQSIGREHVPIRANDFDTGKLPRRFETLLKRIEKANPTRAKITRVYFFEMAQTLKELARVTSVDGRIVLVVGNNAVTGEVVRNDSYFSEILQNSGLELELSLLDDIKSRGLMTKRNRTASVISRESVLIFRKISSK
jgi:tRNA G10  N-methylase Trm11